MTPKLIINGIVYIYTPELSKNILIILLVFELSILIPMNFHLEVKEDALSSMSLSSDSVGKFIKNYPSTDILDPSISNSTYSFTAL